MSGVVSVVSQGCQPQSDNCLSQTCTHHGAPRILHREGKDLKLYVCCCNTDFCNRQFSISSTVLENSTPTPETSKLEYSRFQNSIYHKIPKIRLIFFKSPFRGAYFWKGLYSEGLIYGGKFAFQTRLG